MRNRLNDSRATDRQLRELLPHPIAAAWHRVMTLPDSDSRRIELLRSAFDITLRTLTAILLPDYLRGAPSPEVEALLLLHCEKNPSDGTRLDLVRETIRHLHKRNQPTMFVPEFHEWFFERKGVSESFVALHDMVSLRNEDTHGAPRISDKENKEWADKLHVTMRGLLCAMLWIGKYRLFRIRGNVDPRRGYTEGKIQFYQGNDYETEPTVCRWTARLAPMRGRTVFLCNPDGSLILEISPFILVEHIPSHKERCCLFKRLQRKTRMMQLDCDSEGKAGSIKSHVMLDEGEMPFEQWLEQRQNWEFCHENADVSGTLRYVPLESGACHGTLIAGRFEVIDVLGEGGMAVVYRVSDRHLFGHECALKVLRPELTTDPTIRERFRREARTLADSKFNHPNVLSVNDCSRGGGGVLWMKMPVAEGGTLRERVTHGGLPISMVLEWAEQMLAALAYLHSCEVVHRDVKPSNLFLDQSDMIMLGDFGISLRPNDQRLTATGVEIGTWAYMAPEQRIPGREVTSRTDVFAAAVVLHELVTGEHPGQEPGKGMPQPLRGLVRHMASFEESMRPSAEESLEQVRKLGRDLSAVEGVDGPPPASPTDSPSPPFQRSHSGPTTTMASVRRELEEIHELLGDWAPAAKLLRAKAEKMAPEQADERLIVFRSLLPVYRDEICSEPDVENICRQILNLEPSHSEAWECLTSGLEKRRRWKVLEELFRGKVDSSTSISEKVDLLQDLAERLQGSTSNSPAAIRTWNEVLGLAPEDLRALDALSALYMKRGNWKRYLSTRKRRIDLSPLEERPNAILELARLASTKPRVTALCTSLWEEVLEAGIHRGEALEQLAMLYERSRSFDKAAKCLESLAEESGGDSSQNALRRLAELYRSKLGRPQDATRCAHELRRRMLDDAVKTGNPLAANQLRKEQLDIASNDEERLLLLREIGDCCAQQLDDLAGAADAYAEAWKLTSSEDIGDALLRVYELQSRWGDAEGTLSQLAVVTKDVEKKVEYGIRLASVRYEKLRDLAGAQGAYAQVLELDPTEERAVDALQSLYGETGEWEKLIETLAVRASIHPEEDGALKLISGELIETRLENPMRAAEIYEEVVTHEPSTTEAWERLERIYTEAEVWDRLAETYERLLSHTMDEDDRIELLRKLALLNEAALGDGESVAVAAVDFYQQILDYRSDDIDAIAALERLYKKILEHNPAHSLALEKVIAIYEVEEDWDKIIKTLIRQAKCVHHTERAQTFARMGHYYKDHMADPDRAIEAFEIALELVPNLMDALSPLADVYMECERWEKALPLLEKQRQIQEGTASPDDSARLKQKMDTARVEAGRGKDAPGTAHATGERQLAELVDLVGLMEAHEDWEGAIRYRRQLVSLMGDPLEQWKMLIAIGDTYREKLDNLELAIRAYNEALEAQPYSKSALVKLLEIHINAKSFAEAINILQHLVQVEGNTLKKAAYTFTIATIYRQELGEPDMATDYYEQTLDLNPEKLEAFRGVDELLTEARNWDELEGAYRRMIARVRGKNLDKVEFMLYRGLGEVYRSRLQRPDLAISSFELAAKLNQEDVKTHEILAQLYELQDQQDKAIVSHRMLVCLEPERLESYRQMAAMQRSLGSDDDAWFSLAILAMAGKLNDEEKTFFAGKQPAGLLSPQRSLDANIWLKLLFAKGESVQVGEIFQTIYQAIGVYLEGRDPKDLGLRKKDEVDFKKKTFFTAVFNHVSQLTGIPIPKVYLSEHAFGMRIEATIPPVLVIGKGMLHGKTEKELAFVIAKHLTYFHPMHLLAAAYPAPVLKLLYQVAVRFAHPDAEVEGADSEQFQVLSQHLRKRITPQLGTTLTAAVDQFYLRQQSPGINKWLTGVELTANHAGLLACLDLAVSASVLKQESIAFSKLPPREKAKELVLFAVSEEFSQARQAVGLSLTAPGMAGYPQLEDAEEKLAPAPFHKDRPSSWAAITECQKKLSADSDMVPTLEELYSIYSSAGKLDEAWVVASILVHLSAHSTHAIRHYRGHEQQPPQIPYYILDELLGRTIAESPRLNSIYNMFNAIRSAGAFAYSPMTPSSYGMKKKDMVSRSQQPLLFGLLGIVCDFMGTGLPEVYLTDEVGSIGVHGDRSSSNPFILVDRRIIEEKTALELAFILAKCVTYAGSVAPCLDRGPSGIEEFFWGAVALVKPEFEEKLKRGRLGLPVVYVDCNVSSQELVSIGDAVRKVLESYPDPVCAIDELQFSIELMASQFGLLACGDFNVAAEELRSSGACRDGKSFHHMRFKLIQFAISEEHFKLRRRLGRAIEK